MDIVLARLPAYDTPRGREDVENMIKVANLTRAGFRAGDISTLMSPRTVLAWAENASLFGDRDRAFRLSFLNKCDELERSVIAEYYQRVFGADLMADVPA